MITDNSSKEFKEKRKKQFILILILMFALASFSSIFTEISERMVKLSEYEMKYHGFNSSTNEYIFIDKNKDEILFKGDYNDIKSTKSMKYNGSLYQMRVNAELLYEFYKDNNAIDVFTPYEIEEKHLREDNEEAFLLTEGFKVISMVERKTIFKILIVQFIFIIIASAMYVDPKYFWQIGYLKRQNKKKATRVNLWIIRLESIFIALIIVCFPLVRLL